MKKNTKKMKSFFFTFVEIGIFMGKINKKTEKVQHTTVVQHPYNTPQLSDNHQCNSTTLISPQRKNVFFTLFFQNKYFYVNLQL